MTAVTPSPGFLSIAVSDVQRSAAFYETYLGAIRDTFDFGPQALAFVGWPAFAINSTRPPSPEATGIQIWWRASGAQRPDRNVDRRLRAVHARGRQCRVGARDDVQRASDQVWQVMLGAGADEPRLGALA